MWQGILSIKDVVFKGVCYSLANGLKVDPWAVLWIPWAQRKTIHRNFKDNPFSIVCVKDLSE